MENIPDAPYIRDCETRGTDAVYEWLYGDIPESDEEAGYEDDD